MSGETESTSALLPVFSTDVGTPEGFWSGKEVVNPHWRKLKLTIQAAKRFRSPHVEVVKDLEELIADVSRTPTPYCNTTPCAFLTAVEAFRQLERLFTLISRGSTDDLKELSQILDQDPRRYICAQTDTASLVNRRSMRGHTMIYVAAIMGNVQAVEMLLQHGADAHLQCRVSSTEEESPLDGASRWGHSPVVDFLLSSQSWTKRELKKAAKYAHSESLKGRFAKEMGKWRKKSCCWG